MNRCAGCGEFMRCSLSRMDKEFYCLDCYNSEPFCVNDEDGGIVGARSGGVLYEGHSLEGLSLAARKRLAELHSQFPDLTWEGYMEHGVVVYGAEDILKREGLMS